MSNPAVTILLEQLKDAHKWLEETMEGVTDDVAHFMPPGTANPIAGTYAHVVMSEDFFVNVLLKKSAPLMETEFKDKTGASELQPSEWVTAYPKWLKEVKIDVIKMREYAKAVFSASEEYLATLSDEDLFKEVELSAFGMGMRPVHAVIGGMVVCHARDIMGEISVLKGIQGLKGYPF
jgi:hypothetical protein